MRPIVLLCLFGLALCQTPGKICPGPSQLQRIKQKIRNVYNSNAELLPAAVRLTFHDCNGPNGCDGCLNIATQGFNDGLQDVFRALNAVARSSDVRRYLGHADLWSLAGIVAIEEAIKTNNAFCLTQRNQDCPEMPNHGIRFKWGRVDCPTAPTHTDRFPFPGGNMSRAEMMSFFDRVFGFNEREVTALLGAHNLGKTRKAVSGFEGPWNENKEDHFNNLIYRNMLSNDIEFRNVPITPERPDKHFQFNLFDKRSGVKVGMLLNTDLELAYDIDVGRGASTSTKCVIDNSGFPPRPDPSLPDQCKEKVCPDASTKDLVRTYAENPAIYVRDFSTIYMKMMDKNANKNLQFIGL